MIQTITFKHQVNERSEVGAVVRVAVDDVKSAKAQLKPGEKLSLDVIGEVASLLVYGNSGTVRVGELAHDLKVGPVQWMAGDTFAEDLPAGPIVLENQTTEPIVVTYCLGTKLPVSVLATIAPTGDDVLKGTDAGSSVAETGDAAGGKPSKKK